MPAVGNVPVPLPTGGGVICAGNVPALPAIASSVGIAQDSDPDAGSATRAAVARLITMPRHAAKKSIVSSVPSLDGEGSVEWGAEQAPQTTNHAPCSGTERNSRGVPSRNDVGTLLLK
eukprot:COSAG01_NODE_2188_length_8194_cov_481.771093_2_plen_118_part_00